jgi:hypothetical protein
MCNGLERTCITFLKIILTHNSYSCTVLIDSSASLSPLLFDPSSLRLVSTLSCSKSQSFILSGLASLAFSLQYRDRKQYSVDAVITTASASRIRHNAGGPKVGSHSLGGSTEREQGRISASQSLYVSLTPIWYGRIFFRYYCLPPPR